MNLEKMPLFHGLSQEVLAEINGSCQFQRWDSGGVIIDQFDESDEVFYVLEGKVCAKSYSEAGKEVSFIEVQAGGLFGEFAAIDGQPRSSSVEALDSSLIARQSSASFRNLLRTQGDFAMAIAGLLVEKNRSLSQRIFEVSTFSVFERVCAEILRLADAETDNDTDRAVIEPAPSHHELATRLSTHREAVSRAVSALAGKGIVESGRKRLTVLDITRLRGEIVTMDKSEW